MIDQDPNPPRKARGNVRLTWDGKHYWFATKEEAENGLRMLRHTEATQTVQDGSSPTQAAIE